MGGFPPAVPAAVRSLRALLSREGGKVGVFVCGSAVASAAAVASSWGAASTVFAAWLLPAWLLPAVAERGSRAGCPLAPAVHRDKAVQSSGGAVRL